MSVLRPALSLLLFFTVLTGIAYPIVIAGVARLAFPAQAQGSLITRDGAIVGSRLIGQAFASERYFWSRPSATPERPYNAASSSGSNLGPTNPALATAVAERRSVLRAAHSQGGEPPSDLVTTSASGLDPDISLEAALYQAPRVAKARGLDVVRLSALIEARSHGRLLGLFGEPRVNVLELNLALDAGVTD